VFEARTLNPRLEMVEDLTLDEWGENFLPAGRIKQPGQPDNRGEQVC
jgi:hypothetical protein